MPGYQSSEIVIPSRAQVNILTNMAEMVVRRVELSWALSRQQQQQQQKVLGFAVQNLREVAAYTTPMMFVDTQSEAWLIRYCNAATAELTGTAPWPRIRALLHCLVAYHCDLPFSRRVKVSESRPMCRESTGFPSVEFVKAWVATVRV